MTPPSRIRTTYSDAEALDAEVLMYVPSGTDETTVLAGIDLFAACSVHHVSEVTREDTLVGPDYVAGGEGAWNTHRDFARLTFQKANGSDANVTIAGPLEAIFIGGDLVDEGQADVAALIAWCLAHVTDSNGVVLSEYVSGVRWHQNG